MSRNVGSLAVGSGEDHATSFVNAFRRDGFGAPVRIFEPEECRALMVRLRECPERSAADWFKGWAAASPLYCEIARNDRILDRMTQLIGPDVILWGASLLKREAGVAHPWHTDIESSTPQGRTASVWIGLENTDAQTSLKVVSRSHELGVSVQQIVQEEGAAREAVTDEDVERWARRRDESCRLVATETTNGEALFFDGRLWHGSRNTSKGRTRYALLLQYASADTPIRIPRFERSEWPFEFLRSPRPPCILARGRARDLNVNRIVAPPTAFHNDRLHVISACAHQLQLPLEQDPANHMAMRMALRGSTPDLRFMQCHVSALKPGFEPHAPHRHEEEEVLLVLEGSPELVWQEEEGEGYRSMPTKPGMFVYYPAGFAHSLRNSGEGVATYLMFKWLADSPQTDGERLCVQLVDSRSSADDRKAQASRSDSWRLLLDGPTRCLRRLHCHQTTLKPGGGYDPHVDSYDVGIVLLKGEVETLGERVKAFSVAYFPAGEPHGMRNVGSEDAVYIVFEFHGRHSTLPERQYQHTPKPSAGQRLVRVAKDPRRLVKAIARRAKRLIKR